MSKINYEQECLKINSKLKTLKVNDSYIIITGNNSCHTTHSDFKITRALAWQNCYERLTEKK